MVKLMKRWIFGHMRIRLATEHIERYIDEQQDEGAFAGKLFNLLPDGSDLISGSSMPIRDVDTFFNQDS